jgi:hypothetical protein
VRITRGAKRASSSSGEKRREEPAEAYTYTYISPGAAGYILSTLAVHKSFFPSRDYQAGLLRINSGRVTLLSFRPSARERIEVHPRVRISLGAATGLAANSYKSETPSGNRYISPSPPSLSFSLILG